MSHPDQPLHHEVQRQRARYAELSRLSQVGLFETDGGGHLVYANARMAELLGLDTDALLGQLWTTLFVGATTSLHDTALAWAASAAAGVRFGTEIAVDQGGQQPARMRLESTPLPGNAESPAQGQDGETHGHLFTLVDVTEKLQAAPRRERRGGHDVLTGLADRDRFEGRLHDALTLARVEQTPAAVLFIDLDHFHQINELYGHSVGDTVLKTAAQRLRRAVRADDVVARVGGDEFAVLLQAVASEETLARLQSKIEASLARPMSLGSGHVQVRASVVVLHAPAAGTDVYTLLQGADAEMVRTKRLRARSGPETLQAELAV